MWELIAMAAGIGFGLMGLAAYIKTNLESKKQEKELRNKIVELMEGQIIDPRLLINR